MMACWTWAKVGSDEVQTLQCSVIWKRWGWAIAVTVSASASLRRVLNTSMRPGQMTN